MDFQDLKMIYPSAKLQSTDQLTDNQLLAVPVTEGFGILHKSTLAPKELLLLQLLSTKKGLPQLAEKHLWYRILFQGEPYDKEGLVRVIQLRLRNTKGFLQADWLAEIKDSLPQLLDIFFEEMDVYIIEKHGEQNYRSEELFGLFQALDTDFDLYSQVYVGSFLPTDGQLSRNFQLERHIFLKELDRPRNRKNHTLASALTGALLADQLRDNQLLRALYRQWFNEDINTILESLWDHQGNVSSAAKELFLHRNTVLYRIEKFQDQTQLDLKKMDDLMLCHLLITTFS